MSQNTQKLPKRHNFFYKNMHQDAEKSSGKEKLRWRDICSLPGAKPIPDHKGVSDYCSRFAVSTAIVAYFVMGLAVFGKKIALDQTRVTDILIYLDSNDEKGKWPTEFNQKQCRLRDNHNKYWITTPYIVGDMI